ncbi:hypothetical protein ACLNGM_15085 [Aureimonas phyllosphaerae]|uniref:hypothetical protein n=1 Tax=Aureimonas phyllosphaerae TaxID=1166078 RepID=UPI003A5BFF73
MQQGSGGSPDPPLPLHRTADRRFRGRPVQFFVELTDQLCRAVRHTLFLAERDEKSGITRRESWEEAGVEIEEPEVYDAGSHLVEWFWDADSLCGSTGFGLVPLDALRIQAWAGLTGTTVEPWEGRILLEMSRARQQGPQEDLQSEAPVTQAINPAMFDALFG